MSSTTAVSDVQSGHVYTEENWALEKDCFPCEKSKLKAEHAAWDLMKDLTNENKFDLIVKSSFCD